jgi:hypothetical protein
MILGADAKISPTFQLFHLHKENASYQYPYLRMENQVEQAAADIVPEIEPESAVGMFFPAAAINSDSNHF